MRKIASALVLGLSAALAACGGEQPTNGGSPAAAESASPAAAGVPATGNVVEVKMVTDDKGNYFEPANVTAGPGDVVRFTLVSGVHNASFPASRNPGRSGLPDTGPMLQLPGQTYDVPVTMAPGEYEFVCDPHAALGMVGTLKVEARP